MWLLYMMTAEERMIQMGMMAAAESLGERC